MEKTTLYLPEDLHRELQEAAIRTSRSQAELIREAIRRYLAAQSRPEMTSLGLGSDSGLRGRDSERWLEREWARR
jgi:predicted transcriptional regulator